MSFGNVYGGTVGIDAIIPGGPGNDHLAGTADADSFDVSQGGHDTVRGLGGDDVVSFGAAFDARDRVFGGSGFDKVILNGNYGLNVTLNEHALDGVESLVLQGSFSYALVFSDANVAGHHTLSIDASTVDAAHSVSIDAFQESGGNFTILAGAGNDTISTGAGNDFVLLGVGHDRVATSGGNDVFLCGDGDDRVEFYGDNAMNSHDSVSGGTDYDGVYLFGNYTHQVIDAGLFSSIEYVGLEGGYDFDLDFSQSGMSEAALTTIDNRFNPSSNTLVFTAHGETGQGYIVLAGAGDDTLTGSAGNDQLFGGEGGDRLEGGEGQDSYEWFNVSESHGTAYDTIVGFDADADFFTVGRFTDVTAINRSVRTGTLNSGHFNADLADAITAHHLHANNAVLFRPNAGNLQGEWFLIVDVNGKAGYQANEDLVLHLEKPHHLSDLAADNFIDAI